MPYAYSKVASLIRFPSIDWMGGEGMPVRDGSGTLWQRGTHTARVPVITGSVEDDGNGCMVVKSSSA
jgi:hypothetical protein